MIQISEWHKILKIGLFQWKNILVLNTSILNKQWNTLFQEKGNLFISFFKLKYFSRTFYKFIKWNYRINCVAIWKRVWRASSDYGNRILNWYEILVTRIFSLTTASVLEHLCSELINIYLLPIYRIWNLFKCLIWRIRH